MKEDGQFVFACSNGTEIVLFPNEGATKAEHTAMRFQVKNLETAIKDKE